MREIINENVVLDFYLEEMDRDKITFLVNKPESKAEIKKLIKEMQACPEIHMKIQVAKELWKILFEESMSTLNPDKKGYDELFDYFDDYVDFEELIFASDSFYRDHTLHCLWVYFLGEYLYNQAEFKQTFKYIFNENKELFEIEKYMKETKHKELFTPISDFIGDVLESFRNSDSLRCLAALTHDLGYPLNKIRKVNSCISKILPYFSINHFDEFNFNFSNEQGSTIESFLNLLTLTFEFNAGQSESEFGAKFDEVYLIKDNKVVGFDEKVLDQLTDEEKQEFIEWMTPQLVLKKEVSNYARYSEDFERYEHGIMSAFILYKTLAFNKGFKLQYGNLGKVNMQDVDLKSFLYLSILYRSIANHTSNSCQIDALDSASAFLMLIDEIEEFSRISRADQNRSYIAEFCKSSIYMEEKTFCVDFIFDNKEILNLDPERAFKGRCKKMLSMFDVANLDEDFRLRIRCIDEIWEEHQVYCFELGRKFAQIDIDGVEKDIPSYLKSRELYTSEEYKNL